MKKKIPFVLKKYQIKKVPQSESYINPPFSPGSFRFVFNHPMMKFDNPKLVKRLFFLKLNTFQTFKLLISIHFLKSSLM
jgi:hypothetical protein